MAWQDTMTQILRVFVNDLASETYTDDTLQQTLVVAARLVLMDQITFMQDYTIDVVNVNIAPDPTSTTGGISPDDPFINFTCLKAACIIDRGAAMIAASQAISVKDGSSAVDLRGILAGKLALLQKGGWCAVYQDERWQYQAMQSSASAGSVVMTPFRTLVYGSRGQLLTVPGREREPVY